MDREPSDVKLTLWERQALASIEARAAQQDPDLDALLAASPASPRRRPALSLFLAVVALATTLSLLAVWMLVVVLTTD